MKILISISLILMIATADSFAQRWIPAYIITNGDDTTHGEIKFNKKLVYNHVTFKTEKGGIREFSPDQLKGYSIVNRYFYRDPQASNLVFIEKKIDGPASLFETNLFVSAGSATSQGGYKINYLIKKRDGDYVAVRKTDFKETVSEFVKENKVLSRQVRGGKLKFKDLSEIIEQYNSWHSSKKN